VTTRADDVFSSTLKKADWSNASVLEGDVATEAAKLKAQVGKDLVIYGNGLLGQTSLRHHLLDELKFCIHPCFAGRGKLLFWGGGNTKAQTHRTKNFGSRRNGRLVSAGDNLNSAVADE
jgi:dihydrofolate reductase